MQKERIFLSVFLFFIGGLTTVDIVADAKEGHDMGHLVLEVMIAITAFSLVTFLIYKMAKKKQRIQDLKNEKKILQDLASDLEQKSKIFIEGLGVEIDREFNSWSLSSAEREVALFLLKGLSNQEISKLRDSSEKTIRNQSASIYKKASLSGRQELQAYFLEDLLAPTTTSNYPD
jgi:DNA-binding CsgD family transcriptional regulator